MYRSFIASQNKERRIEHNIAQDQSLGRKRKDCVNYREWKCFKGAYEHSLGTEALLPVKTKKKGLNIT